jgi:hypothetical protein
MTDSKDKNIKMLRLSWNFNHILTRFFNNLKLLAIFSFLALLKSFCWLCYYITLLTDKNKEEKWFSSYKKLKIILL